MAKKEIEFNTGGSTFVTGKPDKCAANMAKLRRELVPRDLTDKLDEITLDDLVDSSFLYVDNGDEAHVGKKINAKQALSGHVEEQIAEHNASEAAHPYIQGKLAEEVTRAETAEAVLQVNITNEATTRANADTAEAATRAAADNTIAQNLTAEEEARRSADTTLQTNIDTEASTRIAKDAETLASAKGYTDTREAAIRAWGQEKLVGQGQGQNIKTINGYNVMGSGNISIAQPDAYIKDAVIDQATQTKLTLVRANDTSITFDPNRVEDVMVNGSSVVEGRVARIDTSEFGKVQDVLVNDVSVVDSEGNAQVSVPTLVSQLANDKGYINTDDSTIGTTIPVDADLLNHQQPSYYSHVEVSNVGTSTSEISYITINGVEKKIAGGGGGGGDLPPYPQDTSKKYALGLKYENGAWVKYWAVTEDPTSSAVGTGVVGSMIIE